MNITQIEENLQQLIKNFRAESFIFDLLLAYGQPKSVITRLQKGSLNVAKNEDELLWKKKVFFAHESANNFHDTLSRLKTEVKHQPRFIILTDNTNLLGYDTKTDDKIDIPLAELPKHFDFFLPWAGMEKASYADENPADVRAAEKMAKLFDEIRKDNPDTAPEFIHSLNVFLSRLLFCFFAEDTHIFTDNQFTNAIASHTQTDGSDLNEYLDKLFGALNTPKNQRQDLPEYLNAFPFVNGGLFRTDVAAPQFSRKSRSILIDCGEQNWSAINPDIFGSMFQAVISTEQRGSLGQHYTSVPNIMKVIEPLFLNELYEELGKAGSDTKKLNALLQRIHNIKIFDPACGSGNFLIIAYKELRQLEMKIFKAGGMMALSGIRLSQFYGIEIDDFAGEIAKLALWLAEHQMNVEFHKEFGRTNPTLPLSEAGKIVHGNATRLDWEVVCPKVKGNEIFILGNPPYLGSSMQNAEQKADLATVFQGFKNYKNLDFIACWFKKGTDFISGNKSKLAFVTTNSISQGEQVGYFWPYVFNKGVEICFAHTSFKWTNNAKSNAGVTVSIIGLSSTLQKSYLYSKGVSHQVSNINAYLSSASNVIVSKRSKPLSYFKEMLYGNKLTDGGFLIVSSEEKENIQEHYPNSAMFFKKIIGSKEFIRGEVRYCIWIEDSKLNIANDIPPIKERIKNVADFRSKSIAKSTREFNKGHHRFIQIQHSPCPSIIIPKVSSERRTYIPMGFLDGDNVISDLAFAIYNAEPYLLGILSSKMHMVWVRTVSGRLKTDYRYSNTLSYNTFPFPPISTQRKNEITQSVFRILDEREKHSEKTLAELYDPDKMPDGLREAHRINDEIIEKCYRSRPFGSDEERLEYLFKLYEKMIAEEQAQGTLFAKQKKTRKKK